MIEIFKLHEESHCLHSIFKDCIERSIKQLTNYLQGLWNPEVQSRIHKGSPIIDILSRINPIIRIQGPN